MKNNHSAIFTLIGWSLFFLLPLLPLSSESGYPGDMLVVGSVEMISVYPPGISYPSRIDTGAAISSLNAYDLSVLKQDGQTCISFHTAVSNEGEESILVLPVERIVQVRQANRPGLQLRYIVQLEIRLGDQTLTGEFSLADRRGMIYPILIGRNLLAGNALVDVSREYIHKK